MATTNGNGTKAFQDTIRAFLEEKALNDNLFAVKFANPSKTIEDCVTFIINDVRKSGCNGFTDEEIFGKAIHYYDENEIEVGSPVSDCQVVVNHTVELTEEEKEQARQDAIARLRDEEIAKMRRPSQSKKATENKPQVEQLSLFDL